LFLAANLFRGLLKSKINTDEWRKILNSNMWDLQDDQSLHVLKITYYCLPQRLKWCFAYCVNFPKCYKFYKEDAIFLWMVASFLLTYGENKKIKETWYIHFKDLVLMSFFE
jgi:hypothetical protein